MKKISVKIVISSLILALMLAFAGCGGPSSIQEYIESSDEAQQQIADTEKSSGCDIDVKDNDMTITYKYDETYSKDQVKAVKKEMEKLVPDMADALEDSISDIKDESGIEDITMTIVFLNGDGSEIYSKKFN